LAANRVSEGEVTPVTKGERWMRLEIQTGCVGYMRGMIFQYGLDHGHRCGVASDMLPYPFTSASISDSERHVASK